MSNVPGRDLVLMHLIVNEWGRHSTTSSALYRHTHTNIPTHVQAHTCVHATYAYAHTNTSKWTNSSSEYTKDLAEALGLWWKHSLFILNLSTPLSSVPLIIWEALPHDLNEIVHAAWNLSSSPIKLWRIIILLKKLAAREEHRNFKNSQALKVPVNKTMLYIKPDITNGCYD